MSGDLTNFAFSGVSFISLNLSNSRPLLTPHQSTILAMAAVVKLIANSPLFADQSIRKAFRADGNRTHGRVRANDTGPADSDDIMHSGIFPAAYQHSWNGIEHSAGFPQQFLQIPGHGTSIKNFITSEYRSKETVFITIARNQYTLNFASEF